MVSLGLNVIFWLLIADINGWLVPLNISLFLEGLLLLFPMIFLRGLPGIMLVGLFALMLDALTPAYFGGRLFLYSGVFAFFHFTRERFRWDQGFRPTIAALIANTLLFTGLTLLTPIPTLTEPTFWLRGTMDILISNVVLAFLAVTYINLHKGILLGLGYRFWQSRETPA